MDTPWYENENRSGRFRLEITLIGRHYPHAKVHINKKTQKLEVMIKVQGRLGEYVVLMVYDDNHPQVSPEAFTVDPEIRNTPHSHPRESNRMCLFTPQMAGPHISGKMILDWAARGWIPAYEVYRETGKWPEDNQSV